MTTAEYHINNDTGDVECTITGINLEDMAMFLNGVRDTHDQYKEYFYSKYMQGNADQVAGRKDTPEILAYLDHLAGLLDRLQSIYDLAGNAEQYV